VVSLVIDNTVQVRLVWGLGGVPYAVNVLHGIIKDPLTTIDQAKADDLRDKVEAVITPQGWIGEVSQHVSLLNIGLRNLNSPNNPEFLATSTYAGKSCTSIFHTASMPSSGYSSTSTWVMQSWASRAAGPPIDPR